MDLSDLVFLLEESSWSRTSEAVQTPEKAGDLPGRGGPIGRLLPLMSEF
jgi:hypothetical protein